MVRVAVCDCCVWDMCSEGPLSVLYDVPWVDIHPRESTDHPGPAC